MAYEFHYTPTGTGVISGKEVLEQTEDAINDLGNTAISGVQEALDKAEQALTNSENAVDDAQTALNTANNAEGVAIQAQNDVSNLSGTVANIGNRVTTAEGNIGNLQGRMTTAEGNITNLQGRMSTAEGNIGNLQTAVSTAQATANSAQQTATTARQQSYVFRYSSTALVASSTNSNTLLDNTDNLKVGDKVIDSSGVLFSVTAIDTQNSTFTIGTALVDLAQDSDVVHKSGNETISGEKTFSNNTYVYNSDTNATTPNLFLKNSKVSKGSTSETGAQLLKFIDKNNFSVGELESLVASTGTTELRIRSNTLDSNNHNVQTGVTLISNISGAKRFCPTSNNDVFLGVTSLKWARVYSTQYYYGNDNIEFSTKFVTTDTNQTISGKKTFDSDTYVYNSDNTATTPNLYLKNSKIEISSQGNTSGEQNLVYLDKNNTVYAYVKGAIQSNGSAVKIRSTAKDSSDNSVISELQILAYTNGNKAIFPSYSNEIDLGVSSYKWKSFNGVEPSSLSLPDLNNGIDISSYITHLDKVVNQYTPPANGWLSIRVNKTSLTHTSVMMYQNNGLMSVCETTEFSSSGANLPVIANKNVDIYIYAGVLVEAKFYPCQGNV